MLLCQKGMINLFDENKALATIYSGDADRIIDYVDSCGDPEAAKEWLTERIMCYHTQQEYCIIAEALADLGYNASVRNMFQLAVRCMKNNWDSSYSRVIKALSYLDFIAYSKGCINACRHYVSTIKQSADGIINAEKNHSDIDLKKEMEEVCHHMTTIEEFVTALEVVIEDTSVVYRRRNIGFTGNVK